MEYQGFGLGTSSAFRPFGTQDDDEFGDSVEPQVTWQSSQVVNIRALLGDKKSSSKGRERGSSSRRTSATGSSAAKTSSKSSRRSSLPKPAGPGGSPDDPILIETQDSPVHSRTTPSSESSSMYASASSTPSSGPSTTTTSASNSFGNSEWDFFPPCFAGSSTSRGSSKEASSAGPNPGPIRRTKDPKRLRAKVAPMHRPFEGMDVQDEEGEREVEETKSSTSVDSLQAMLRQFGTAVKERAAREEVEVPVKAKVDSKGRAAAAAGPSSSSSRRRDERREGSRLVDRTNGVGTKVGGDGRAQVADGLNAVDPPSTRTTTTAQGSFSSRGSSAKLEERATSRASPAAAEVQRPATFKEPLPPTRREDKSAAGFVAKDMPPPPIPRRASSSREEQMPPPPPAIKEQRPVAPAAKAASPQPSSSQTSGGAPSSSQGRRLGMTTYAATSSQQKTNEPTRAADSHKGAVPFKSKSLGMRSAITNSPTAPGGSQTGGGFKRSTSNRLPPFQPPIMKKSMSPVPHPPPPPPRSAPAPEKKKSSTAMWVDEDGDVSMTSSAADTSYGNSFEIDPGELDAIMSPYEQR